MREGNAEAGVPYAIQDCLTATLGRLHHSNRTSGPYFLHSLTPANESSSIPFVLFAQYKQLGKLLQSCRRDAVLCLKARILLPKEPYLHMWDRHLPRVPLSSTNQSCYQTNQSWGCLWLHCLKFSTSLPSPTFSNKRGVDPGELDFLGWSHRTWFPNIKNTSPWY